MARHHFVPLFLLRRWAVNGISFEPSVGRVIENARAIVASACQIKNLNTFFAVPAAQRDFPETQFFTPCVDTPAATALDVMLAKGVSALTEAQRMDWTRLLVSFGVRWVRKRSPRPSILLKLPPHLRANGQAPAAHPADYPSAHAGVGRVA